MDEPGARRDGLDDQPLVVDRHPDHLGPQRGHQPPWRPVPGALDRDPVAGGEQHPGHHVDRLLGAVGHHPGYRDWPGRLDRYWHSYQSP
jgi:hypothetical protein